MTSRDPRRCCDPVRSAILATAWLLVLDMHRITNPSGVSSDNIIIFSLIWHAPPGSPYFVRTSPHRVSSTIGVGWDSWNVTCPFITGYSSRSHYSCTMHSLAVVRSTTSWHLLPVTPVRSMRSTARSDVIVPRCRTKFGSRAFLSSRTRSVEPSPAVRSVSRYTVGQFRRLLKTHYFQLHFRPN